jgi:hypothetical protein
VPAAYPLVSLFWSWVGTATWGHYVFSDYGQTLQTAQLVIFPFCNGLTPASLILEFFPRFDIYNWKELERNPDLARIPLGGNIGAISVKIHFLRFYIPCIELPSLSQECQVSVESAKFARNLAFQKFRPNLAVPSLNRRTDNTQ